MAQVVEHLASKGEALSSNPNSKRGRERERRRKRKRKKRKRYVLGRTSGLIIETRFRETKEFWDKAPKGLGQKRP
jgi:hypothetical protein